MSKQRKRKRRTHVKLETPVVAVCNTTQEPHLRHRAYWHEGDMYYRGKVLVKAETTTEE
jgi:large subunit ribosomal protein L32